MTPQQTIQLAPMLESAMNDLTAYIIYSQDVTRTIQTNDPDPRNLRYLAAQHYVARALRLLLEAHRELTR